MEFKFWNNISQHDPTILEINFWFYSNPLRLKLRFNETTTNNPLEFKFIVLYFHFEEKSRMMAAKYALQPNLNDSDSVCNFSVNVITKYVETSNHL